MPTREPAEDSVLNKSQDQAVLAVSRSDSVSSKRTVSTISTRSQRRSPSPSQDSRTPLTPDESPEIRVTRKRNASTAEAEDKDIEETDINSSHTAVRSAELPVQVCICQPDPKIPRPRNAFILYRQHHQASVVAQHPGLANPEISKIIGEQWRNQPPEVKNEWKTLAEEEKLRHQQQYPSYRYQPKRNGRRNSLTTEAASSAPGEKARCKKCGGRTILSFPHKDSVTGSPHSSSLPPPTPNSGVTPVSRTLPVLRDLSLQSPAARRSGRPFQSTMQVAHTSHFDERDNLGPLSPDNKRRRYNVDYPQSAYRPLHRHGAAPYTVTPGPSTPFPFGQAPSHAYPPHSSHSRRDSLPGLRRVVSPSLPMAPPPRPVIGYQQHRLSQGHVPDRSLTLPPLQTNAASGGVAGAVAAAGIPKSAEEVIMGMDLHYKIKVLGDISPPTRLHNGTPKGLLIAIEADSAVAAQDLAKWLADTLRKEDGRPVSVIPSPDISTQSSRNQAMAQYHRLVASWLEKSEDIMEDLTLKPSRHPENSAVTDTSPATPSERHVEAHASATAAQETLPDAPPAETSHRSSSGTSEKVELTPHSTKRARPVGIIPNYSLHASNVFACRISIGDAYSPRDHWQWAATQWRGTAAPDLTIYIKDGIAADSGKQSGGGVEILEPLRLFVVKRLKVDGGDALEVEPSVLRRLGFEVGERVMAGDADGGTVESSA